MPAHQAGIAFESPDEFNIAWDKTVIVTVQVTTPQNLPKLFVTHY